MGDVYCIPSKRSFDEYEFRQNVPVTDYVDAALLWTLAVSWATIEICTVHGKTDLDVEEVKRFFFLKSKVVKIPYSWEAQNSLVRAMTAGLEAFWRCVRELWEKLAEEDAFNPRIRNPNIRSNLLLSCALYTQLALHDARCDPQKIHAIMEKYLKDPDAAEEKVIEKNAELGLFIPCRFQEYLREKGLDLDLPFCPYSPRRAPR